MSGRLAQRLVVALPSPFRDHPVQDRKSCLALKPFGCRAIVVGKTVGDLRVQQRVVILNIDLLSGLVQLNDVACPRVKDFACLFERQLEAEAPISVRDRNRDHLRLVYAGTPPAVTFHEAGR